MRSFVATVCLVLAVCVAHAELPAGPADGYADVARANGFGEAKDYAGGDQFVAGLRARPRDQLNVEQRQSEDMAEFALYRRDANSRDRCIALLKKVHGADPGTLWGWAAYGFLKDYGVDAVPATDPLRHLGALADGVVNLEVRLLEKNPQAPPGLAARFLAEETDQLGELSQIADGGALSPRRRLAVLRVQLLASAGTETVDEVLACTDGVRLFNRLWEDEKTLDDFLLSGPAFGAPAALRHLMTIFLNDAGDWTSTDLGRRIAVAVALNAGESDPAAAVRHCAAYRRLAEKGLFEKSALALDAREWRFVVRQPIDPADVLFLNTRAYPADRPGRMIRNVPYRMRNCFGDHIHAKGGVYYQPWRYCDWPEQYLRTRVGGVCTQQSRFAALCANSHGVMAYRAGQPGHCAWVRRDGNGRWVIHNNIKPYTAGVFQLWGKGYQYVAMGEHAFADMEKFRASELMRFLAERAERAGASPEAAGKLHHRALDACPKNYGAWRSYTDWLKRAKATEAQWMTYLAELANMMADGRQATWDLAAEALAQIEMGAKDARGRAVVADETVKLFHALPQPMNAWIGEEMNFRRGALERTLGRFNASPDVQLRAVRAALDANWGRSAYFTQVFAYGMDRFRKDAELSQKFLETVADVAAKHTPKGGKPSVDWRALALAASRSGQRGTFRQVAAIRDRLDPPKGDLKFPERDYGAQLLSAEALLKTSSTSRSDTPENYARVTDLTPLDAACKYLFHTGSEIAPWAVVELPGLATVHGITVWNHATQDPAVAKRAVPLVVWVSEEGKEWTEVRAVETAAETFRIDLASLPPKAKYVKVGRRPDAAKDGFHLRKILVYGTPFY